ncbi:hypothetical protein [Natrialbaceae archaeon AArc-T1-2]|uniref:hypothetical protein n=1 Tax=Natrialbaceae archaeon AArc-T1-2 TaxID=3053904 RepID=UPI00255ADF37|nr:hypothetical protein [Natrialbaceae archaeon AArc-T1-2]WIV67467.1 hypothetical protein QQ977_01690 [Natrialbaceae archaeon AArc-T1-2]
MGDKKFTVIELHLDGDTQLGPARLTDILGSESAEAEDESTTPETETETKIETDEDVGAATAADDSGGKGAVGLVVALVVLVALGVAVKKFRGGDDEESPQRDEPDVVVN